MLFLADPVRAATTGAVTRSGPRRADARSRAYAGEKLLPAVSSSGERFVESGNDQASASEVLVFALLVFLFDPSPIETQERAFGARARTCRAERASWATAAAPAGSGRSWAPGRLFPAASHAPHPSP